MYKLTQKIKDLIQSDTTLQGKLADKAGKSVFTILRWLRDDDQKLTMLSLLNVIREHANISKKDSMLEEIAA